MERINTPTRIIDKFGPGRDGFGDGNPTTGAPSTQLNATWFDNSQEEICNAIELEGITLDPADMTQLSQAIRRAVADGPYVLRAGDTMTGQLTVNADIVATNNVLADAFAVSAIAGFYLGHEGPSAVINFDAGDRRIFINAADSSFDLIYAPTTPGTPWFRSENATGDFHIFGTFHAPTGGLVTLGGIQTTGGGITAFGGITTTAGGITAPTGDIVAGANMQAGVDLNVISGHLSVITGNIQVLAGEGFKPGGGLWLDVLSDLRGKDIIGDFSQGLAEVRQLQAKRYTFKSNVSLDNDTMLNSADENIGYIAQEVELVMPEMVRIRPAYIDGELVDDLRTLNATNVIYALVNAVKELAERVETLETARG